MEFNQKLKEQRTGHNLSQEQLAEKLHIARQSISKWERGEAYPSIGMLLQLSDLFGVTVDELLRDDERLKKEIVKGSEKVKHPRWVSFFEWVFLTGAALLLTKATIGVLTYFEVVGLEADFLRGWIPALIPAVLMLIGAIASEELKKNVRR